MFWLPCGKSWWEWGLALNPNRKYFGWFAALAGTGWVCLLLRRASLFNGQTGGRAAALHNMSADMGRGQATPPTTTPTQHHPPTSRAHVHALNSHPRPSWGRNPSHQVGITSQRQGPHTMWVRNAEQHRGCAHHTEAVPTSWDICGVVTPLALDGPRRCDLRRLIAQ